jgi:asparagine synthase (glutamine-hydrolysing)
MATLYCWIRAREHAMLVRHANTVEPVERLFAREWNGDADVGATGVERLSAHVREIDFRLILASDFLFKVDTASMKESLEIRVPLLDEDLVDFSLRLPHSLKVKGRSCKLVLREVARKRLPGSVAARPKQGFSVPVDRWVDHEFRQRLEQTLTSDSRLPEFFEKRIYSRWLQAFCARQTLDGISRAGLYQRVMMLLAADLALKEAR